MYYWINLNEFTRNIGEEGAGEEITELNEKILGFNNTYAMLSVFISFVYRNNNAKIKALKSNKCLYSQVQVIRFLENMEHHL